MAESLTHILVVDDDARLRDLLQQYLSDSGFFVTTADSAAQAREKLAFFQYDAMVLDVMMPGESGLEFARSLQQSSAPPILMLTAMGEGEDRINGLEAGVQDYLTKPFEPRELVLRLQNILRLARSQQVAAKTLSFGAFEFQLDSRQLLQRGEPVYLTASEAACLHLLAQAAGESVSREALADVSGADKSNLRSVDVQMNRLRKKIEPHSSRPIYIQTVRGAGYRLAV